MDYRLVEVLEYGWDLAVKCEACGRSERHSRDQFVITWRKYLNAPIGELTKRLKCSCGERACRSYVLGGSYAHYGMVFDYLEGRARWIRRTLSDAGLDPATYGYPPIEGERTGRNEKGPAG